MMKKLLCLAMTVFMAVSAPMSVFAAEDTTSTNDREWTVRYDGSNLKTEQVDGAVDLSTPFTDIEPGQSIKLEAKIKNDSSNKADWYMSNAILKSMEESVNSASGAAYTYVLTYHDSEGNAPVEIYNSSSVGGTTVTTVENTAKTATVEETYEGLKEVKDLEDYFYLDRLLPGEEAYVRLYVELDGATHVNTYQNAMAELQLNFAVEKILEGTIKKEITKVNTETIERFIPRVEYRVAKTGDSAQLALFSGILTVSGLVLIILAVRAIMKRQNRKGEVQ